jgi:hypothetical protein
MNERKQKREQNNKLIHGGMLTSEFSRIWGIHDTIIIMDAQTGLLSPRGGYGHHIWWGRFFVGGAHLVELLFGQQQKGRQWAPMPPRQYLPILP